MRDYADEFIDWFELLYKVNEGMKGEEIYKTVIEGFDLEKEFIQTIAEDNLTMAEAITDDKYMRDWVINSDFNMRELKEWLRDTPEYEDEIDSICEEIENSGDNDTGWEWRNSR